jgi:hypothetical protein
MHSQTIMPEDSVQRMVVLRRFRAVLCFFIFALIVSGITAFPLQRELDAVAAARGLDRVAATDASNSFDHWILTVRDGLRESYARHPWLAYGTDWLAFAHIVIAVFFIGPLVDPVRNVWVLRAGIIACLLVIPLAPVGPHLWSASPDTIWLASDRLLFRGRWRYTAFLLPQTCWNP